MKVPKWAAALLRWLAPSDRVEDLLGDLEETHARRVERYGQAPAAVITLLEAVDVGVAVLRERRRRRRTGTEPPGSGLEARRGWGLVSWLDFKLGFRMLVRYPGLTVVGGLATALRSGWAPSRSS